MGQAAAPRPGGPPRLAVDDFRTDAVALVWAQGELQGESSWPDGYAQLVRAVATARTVGRQPGSALASVERGEATWTPLPLSYRTTHSARWALGKASEAAGKPEWVEGVAVVRGGRNPGLAQEFIRFLASRGRAERPPSDRDDQAPEAWELLADLLGATLVDAQDELRAAWERLDEAGHPDRAERWMTEPPPWPPASIQKMLQRDDDGAALLETLSRELAPEAELRAWLMRSWLGPARYVDGALLSELARTDEGRLARAPRLRAWLRAEWTAWARQRYRRVARLAESAVPGPESPSS
jgi:hypothetical protein